MEATEVISEIHAAFDGVPPPQRVSLRVARAADDYIPEDKWQSIRASDTDTRWQDIPDSDLEEYWDVHPFLDAPAFQYYIPAFMVWSIKYYLTSDLATASWTLSSLEQQPGRLEILTPKQRNAVAQFLKLAAASWDRFDAKQATDLYRQHWRQYDELPNSGINGIAAIGSS